MYQSRSRTQKRFDCFNGLSLKAVHFDDQDRLGQPQPFWPASTGLTDLPFYQTVHFKSLRAVKFQPSAFIGWLRENTIYLSEKLNLTHFLTSPHSVCLKYYFCHIESLVVTFDKTKKNETVVRFSSF